MISTPANDQADRGDSGKRARERIEYTLERGHHRILRNYGDILFTVMPLLDDTHDVFTRARNTVAVDGLDQQAEQSLYIEKRLRIGDRHHDDLVDIDHHRRALWR